MTLAHKQCLPCEDAKPEHLLSNEVTQNYLLELKEWHLHAAGKSIEKEFKFADFLKSMSFVEQVADVAEEAGHHPDIHIFYDKVRLELSTHSLGGLTENDFIVASRIDGLWLV